MLPALFLSLLILTSAADARHVHFNIQHPLLLDQHPIPTPISQSLLARPTTIYRPRDPAALDRARMRSLRYGQSEPLEWYEKEVLAPDIEDRHTIEQLGRMAGNAYALPGQKNWYDVDTAWNTVRSIFLSQIPNSQLSDISEFPVWLGGPCKRLQGQRLPLFR